MSALSTTNTQALGMPEATKLLFAELEPWIARLFYHWADQHEHDVVFSTKILFIRINVTVGDLETLFGWLVGPRP